MTAVVVETKEISSAPPTPQKHSPITTPPPCKASPTTPETPSRSPVASRPVLKVVVTMPDYLVDVGQLAGLDPVDEWLPITESRKGNAVYSAFHTLCSGIGFQALLLPVAFATLGLAWGIICLSLLFVWQLHTLWILTRLHELPSGIRCSRYLHLCIIAFGDKLGKCLGKFPVMYLSGGTCTTLIIIGGGSLKLFYEIVCGPTCTSKPLTGIEWYLVFVCLATVISQLPNLNSIAGVSLVGAVTAVGYCTITWVLSVALGRPAGVSYDPGTGKAEVGRILGVLNGLGILAFAFRGHNLTLEIQATMPSTQMNPSYVPMWRGVKIAYALIALCFYPIAIGGYWSYGDMILEDGILATLRKFHGRAIPRAALGLTTLLVVVSCLSSFQIYAMPVFDVLESCYTSKHNRPCPRRVRSGIRVFFGGLTFLISVAFPFLPDLAGLLGGVALPVTLAYPCIMWALIKKPEKGSNMWCITWGLGSIGMGLSIVLTAAALRNLLATGLNLHFFKARKIYV